jgi:[amino group carrier protein]-lysine/ornithine hydrolase
MMIEEKINSVGLLYSLLVCYSPSGGEGNATSSLAAFMSQAGFGVTVDRVGNVIGSIGEGPREIVLLGHIDTVAGYIQPVFDGDALYGRGAVDAKGPLACFTSAAAVVGARPGWKITVIGAVGEEADSRGAKYLSETYSSPDFAVIGEPSGWDSVTIGYKGGVWGEYRIQRANGHTAGKAQNACEGAVAFWNRVLTAAGQYNQSCDRVFDQISPTLTGMQSQENGYHQQASLKFNVRIPPAVTPDHLSQMLGALVDDGQIRLDEGIPAYKSEKNNPLARHFIASIRQTGGKPGYKLKTGTSDMNVIGPVWSCPIVAYGPGDSTLDHTPDEHISIADYTRGIEVLVSALSAITAEMT